MARQREAGRGGFPLVCNGDESYPVSVTGWELSAVSAPGGQAELDVHVALPLAEKGIAMPVSR